MQFVPGRVAGVRFYEKRLWSFSLDTLWLRPYQRSVKTRNGIAHFRFFAPSLAAQLFGCFGLLDAGPY
jgi:hypothetical protein